MNTPRPRYLAAVAFTLGLSLLTAADATVRDDLIAAARADLCAAVPTPLPAGRGAVGDLPKIATVIAWAPDANITGLIGALGQMIVEAELSHAAVSGRFEPVINASVAGSDFVLEVCRDSIVGEVSVAARGGVRFVIGDFDGDGVTDVAVRRIGSPAWSVDLGAMRWTALRHVVPAPVRLIEAAQPGGAGPNGAGRCRITWLAHGLDSVDGGQARG